MFNNSCLNINEQENLTIGGLDTVELANEFGTPLYVFDEQTIRSACRDFKNSIDECYGGNGLVLYASKAFSCKEIYRIVNSEGLGIDVVSGGELYTALSVGFPAEKIVFHGNNKTFDEINYSILSGVGRIIVDNLTELKIIQEIAQTLDKSVDIMFRIKPGIDAHTHDFIKTGQIDSKFGFAIETGEAKTAVSEAIKMKNVKLTGVHCHIGSQIFEIEPFCLAASVMIKFMAEMNDIGANMTELNLGGGFGIRYTDDDEPLPFGDFMKAVSKTITSECNRLLMKVPKIYIEPGRSIVGSAGITLYTVGSIKTIPEIRTYVAIDGGMCDNPRYALYSASYELLIANKAALPKDFIATIAGKCCESGDLIQENTKIQNPCVGDIMAVLATGAYNYSMASNYNRIPRPAVVMVNDDKARLIIKRETYDNLILNDI